MDENYKRSIKRAYVRQQQKLRSREEQRLLKENSKRRRTSAKKRTRRHDWLEGGEEDLAPDFEPIRSAPQLDLEAAKRQAAAESAAREAELEGTESGLVVFVARDRIVARRDGVELTVELVPGGPRPAVGDQAHWQPAGDGGARLVSLGERRTRLSRPDPANPRLERVLAANVDLAVIVAAARNPGLRPALIDRLWIAVENGGAQPLLCVNKIDLLESDAERAALERELEPHRSLGLRTILASAESGEGLEELRAELAGQTCVFVGHSGVGKSSLLNWLDPANERSVRTGREFDGKGRHTTSASQLVELPGGTRLIDTPGIRAFGLWRIGRDELRHHFPELAELAPNCRYRDCSHLVEPGCAVREAVEDGLVPRSRHAAYRRIHDSLTD